MTKRFKILILIIAAALIISSCASNTETAQPTQAPQATQASAPTAAAPQAGYPAPTPSDQGQTVPGGYPAPAEVPPLTNTGYPGPGTFLLTLADGSNKTMSVDVLNSLPKEKVSFDGTELEVLALVDALKQYDVVTYNQITAVGVGSTSLTLTSDQIAQSYLDILPDGTIRIAVQGLPQNAWVAALASMKIE
jgi:hypothetical protein